VRTRASAYIWNAWSDGTFEYRAENMSGQTWKAMLAAAKDDPAIRERCEFYLHRAPEEFYQLGSDPTERGNRITDPACAAEVKAMRQRLAGWMERNHDPLAGKFAQLQDGSGGSGAQ
jgi:N-sulfoglucosamine sulfohydrolase